MTNETLSACIDGACEDMAEALRSVEASDESRQTWSRYHLIGDAMPRVPRAKRRGLHQTDRTVMLLMR